MWSSSVGTCTQFHRSLLWVLLLEGVADDYGLYLTTMSLDHLLMVACLRRYGQTCATLWCGHKPCFLWRVAMLWQWSHNVFCGTWSPDTAYNSGFQRWESSEQHHVSPIPLLYFGEQISRKARYHKNYIQY